MESYPRNTALNPRQFIRQIESLLTKKNQIDFISHFKNGQSTALGIDARKFTVAMPHAFQ